MKWSLKAPRIGDMVRVKVGSIYHYGIFENENSVIQFGPSPALRVGIPDKDIEVCVSDVDGFINGGFLEVGIIEKKDGKVVRKKEKVVLFAKQRIGEKGYNILYNNCEHFAYECIFNKKVCTQAVDVREKIKSIPLLELFYAKIPENCEISTVYPLERNNEILKCSNQKVINEKYWVWKLLEYALKKTFNKKIEDIEFRKLKNGKWITDFCEFSLSHSRGIVAVALSRKSVGVDVQEVSEVNERAILRVLNKKQVLEYEDSVNKTEYLIKKWTEKESAYKFLNAPKFRPSKINTEEFSFNTINLELDDKLYLLTICSPDLSKLKVNEWVNLI